MSEYDQFSQLYDWEHRTFESDLVLYTNLARRCNGPILDLGCGSGRITLPLAKMGLDVTGIDNSVSMLSLARQRAGELEGVQVSFLELDVRHLDNVPHFALALFALNGFLHLPTIEDQQLALSSIYRVLLPGGFVVLDLPNPHTMFIPDQDRQLFLRSRFTSPTGEPIWCFANSETDLVNQVQRLSLFYDRVLNKPSDDDAMIHRTSIHLDLRFVYRYEMRHLLERAGFVVDAVYGSYDLDPYEQDSDHMIFIAFKPSHKID